MRLYKFKGAGELLHLLDIAVHERLFCQVYSRLNDPFEGQFRSVTQYANIANLGFGQGNFSSRPLAHPGRVNYHSIDDLLVHGGTRVCSLSGSLTDVRMWSLYADSHQGVAMEIDFEGIEHHVRRVQYFEVLPKFGTTILGGATPEEVLSCKTTHWEYEKEYRIIGTDSHFGVEGRIQRVVVGLRAPDELVSLLEKVTHPRVTIARASLDREGIAVQIGEVLRPGVRDDAR